MWLKCTKFDFCWGCSLAGLKGPTSKGRDGTGREGREREGRGKEDLL